MKWWQPMFSSFPIIQSWKWGKKKNTPGRKFRAPEKIFGFDSTQDPTGFQPLISGSRNSHSEEVVKESPTDMFFKDAKINVPGNAARFKRTCTIHCSFCDFYDVCTDLVQVLKWIALTEVNTCLWKVHECLKKPSLTQIWGGIACKIDDIHGIQWLPKIFAQSILYTKHSGT